MSMNSYDTVIQNFEDILGVPEEERSKNYSVVDLLKSQLNVHIYNINPRKKKTLCILLRQPRPLPLLP